MTVERLKELAYGPDDAWELTPWRPGPEAEPEPEPDPIPEPSVEPDPNERCPICCYLVTGIGHRLTCADRQRT